MIKNIEQMNLYITFSLPFELMTNSIQMSDGIKHQLPAPHMTFWFQVPQVEVIVRTRMKILAIDQSTSIGSLSLLENTTPLVDIKLSERALRSQEIFPRLTTLMQEQKLQPEDIDALAVNLGPGSFSGVRMSIATAGGFTLPDNKPVIGVGIGEAIAMNILSEDDDRSLAVIGDARRSSFWYAVFQRKGNRIITIRDYALTTPEDIGTAVKEATTICSPDWGRIGAVLTEHLSGLTLIEGDQVPSATNVGILAYHILEDDLEPRALQPIYMHPAVASPS